MTEKEWVRLGGKDGVYLVEGEDYTVDREKGILTINEEAWAKVHERKRIAGGEQYAYPPPSGILPHVLSFGGEFTDIEDIELKNITWHGSIEDINGKIHIDGKKQEEKE